MADPNLVDFYSRVARFEKARAAGYGFDAAGTLGRSAFEKPVRKRRSLLPILLLVMAAGFGLKGMIYHSVGAASYNERVEKLLAGEGFDRLGGWLMQEEPVTLYVSDRIDAAITYVTKAAEENAKS